MSYAEVTECINSSWDDNVNHSLIGRTTAVWGGALLLILTATAGAQPREGRSRPGVPEGYRKPDALKAGMMAPDFELVKFEAVFGNADVPPSAKSGNATRRDSMVKLSSSRGKKPVFLIFSSYT